MQTLSRAESVPQAGGIKGGDDLLPIGVSVPTDELVQQILAHDFEWGVGDDT